MSCPAAAEALCIQGWSQSDYNRDSGNAIASSYPLTGIRHVASCNSDSKIPISSYESRNLVGPSVPRIGHQMLYLSLPENHVGHDEDKSPTIPIGLPAALIASILTTVLHSRLLAGRAQATGLKCRDIPSLQKTRIALQALSLGFLLAVFLAVLEVSLRRLF